MHEGPFIVYFVTELGNCFSRFLFWRFSFILKIASNFNYHQIKVFNSSRAIISDPSLQLHQFFVYMSSNGFDVTFGLI